jgi:hypothetical protein
MYKLQLQPIEVEAIVARESTRRLDTVLNVALVDGVIRIRLATLCMMVILDC